MSNILPGENFYQYVNSNWLNNPENQIPSDYSSWGGFTKLQDEGIYNQINIVKNLEGNLATIEQEKIFSIWKATRDMFDSWNNNKNDYTSLIKELDILNQSFETFYNVDKNEIINRDNYINCLSKYLHYTQINGISNVIDFDTGSDLKNVNNVVLDFSVGGLSLPSQEYYKSEDFKEKLLLFKNHLENVKNILNNVSIQLDSNFVDNVIQFEDYIANYTMKPDQSREYDKYYTNTNLVDLYKNINNLNSLDRKQENYNDDDKNFKLNEKEIKQVETLLENIYELFDFRNILNQNLDKNFHNVDEKPHQYHITAYDGDGIRRCFHLILNTDNYNKYRSYMQYQIIRNVSSFCSKELDEEFFDFYSRKLGGQETQKSIEKRSINIVNCYAGEMMGKLFVEKYFPQDSKKKMKQMIDNVLYVMKDSLQNNDWLTDETKDRAIFKLDKFRSKIGFPDIWKDYSDFDIQMGDSLYEISKKSKKWSLRVNFFEKINSILDREEWLMTPQTVNAYFMPTQNEIVFPAAILQPPFFHKTKDTIDFDIDEELEMVTELDILTPANYGGIGAVIAHEITHGYDDKGRKFDENGNLNDWWNTEDEQLFLSKTEIMVNSVEKYLYKDSENEKEYKMNPQLTMGENLADIGGLSLSMKALLKKLAEDNADNITIKASLRVFFKSWANVWKQNIKKDKRIMLLNVDPHAPTDFRGNLVQHFDKFYEVFDIKRNDKMFLEEKDRIKMW